MTRERAPLPAGLVVPSWQRGSDRSPADRAAVGFRYVGEMTGIWSRRRVTFENLGEKNLVFCTRPSVFISSFPGASLVEGWCGNYWGVHGSYKG